MNTTKFALAAIVGIGLLSAPAMGQTAEDLKKAIDKLEKATKDLQEAKDALKVDDLRSRAVKIDTTIELIDKDIQEIKRDIRDIKRKIDANTSTSLKPTESRFGAGMGRVRLINEFSEEMSVVLNGRSYRLIPGEERLVNVPAGDYTYQVLQLQRFPQERTIAENETRTVRIYPR